MWTLSLKSRSGEKLDLATVDLNGNVHANNSMDHPLVVKLCEFLFGLDLLSVELLVNGEAQSVPKGRVQAIFDAVDKARNGE